MHVLVAANSDSPLVLMQLHQTMDFYSGPITRDIDVPRISA